MEQNDKPLENEKQLELIYQMITHAKQDIIDNGFIFLLWGWLVFIASMTQFIFLMFGSDKGSLAWLLMFLGAIITTVHSVREGRNRKVKTYIDKFLGYVWTAFGVALFIVLMFQVKLNINTFPMVITLYGMGTFITGGTVKFKPLIYGGIWCWLLAIGCFFIDAKFQLLFLAASVLGSYIIPGFLLRKRYRQNEVRRA